MKRILASLFIAVTSCGQAIPAKPITKQPTNPEYEFTNIDIADGLRAPLIEYLALCGHFGFQAMCDHNLSKIKSVLFVETFDESLVVGKCSIFSNGDRTIAIKLSAYQYSSYTTNALFKHEAHHCLMNSGHAPAGTAHLMAPTLLPEDYMKATWASLIVSLFQVRYPWGDNLAVTTKLYEDGSEIILEGPHESSGNL